MSEAAKVRLVRCPKCQNLLPELTDYSVYQCGGCGAVLRASKMNGELDTFSEKFDEDGVGGVSAKSENLEFLEKRMMNLRDGSEKDMKSNASSSSRAGRVMQDKAENLKNKAEKRVVEEDTDVHRNIDEANNVKMGTEFEDLRPTGVDESGMRRSGHMADRRIVERDEIEGFQRAQRTNIGHRRYLDSRFPEEGPSSYYSDSSSIYGEPLKNRSDGPGFNQVDYAGDDRAELLRKLDELKDQLSRSYEVAEKPKEKIPYNGRSVHHGPYSGSDDWFSDSAAGVNLPFVQYPVPDQLMVRPPYVNHYVEPSVYMNMHGMANHQGFYPPAHFRGHAQGVGDPLRPQIQRRGPPLAPAPPIQPTHGYFSGHYMNNDMVHTDSFESYPPNIKQHHLSCTCYYCYNKSQIPNKRFSDIPSDLVPYHHESTSSFGTRDYGSRSSNMPPFKSHNLQSHTRWPSDLDSEASSFVPHQPPQMQPSTSVHRCRPIAGGAPFLMCYNCFESLQVPQKVLSNDSNQKKMRCGSCSTVIVFEVSHKNLFVSINEAAKASTSKAGNNHKVTPKGVNSHTQGHPNRASLTFSSDDYDHSCYDFQSMDREHVSQSTDQPGSAKSAGVKSLRSASLSASEDESSLVNLADSGKNFGNTKLPSKDKSPPPAGSSLQDYFDYSNKYNRGNRFENGNRSKHSDPETLVAKKATSPQNSMKDASEPTELVISSNEYFNTGTSSGSGEPSREGDQLRANKGAESFFAGIIKKSFRDSNKSNQKVEQEKASVTVNGHLIPARLIKKAEKIAGPIQPGHYWYDFRAGFWGVMGGPCLGIIPPFIEEFNYSLPENCAGGNTSVFVNGRELHLRDLNLLTSRGLPNERNRYYIIEISGRVLDEETGDELESLGKLAPTVERARHGFGMKPPKAAA